MNRESSRSRSPTIRVETSPQLGLSNSKKNRASFSEVRSRINTPSAIQATDSALVSWPNPWLIIPYCGLASMRSRYLNDPDRMTTQPKIYRSQGSSSTNSLPQMWRYETTPIYRIVWLRWLHPTQSRWLVISCSAETQTLGGYEVSIVPLTSSLTLRSTKTVWLINLSNTNSLSPGTCKWNWAVYMYSKVAPAYEPYLATYD